MVAGKFHRLQELFNQTGITRIVLQMQNTERLLHGSKVSDSD